MYEIDASTIVLIGIDDNSTKVITLDNEFIVEENAKNIVNNSCKYFGSSLVDRIRATSRLIKVSSKVPIVIEETRNIIFFPLRSTREKNNIWISFSNLEKYEKLDKNTILYFKQNKKVILNFSYYIIDNQVTRSMMLDYEINKRRKSLEN